MYSSEVPTNERASSPNSGATSSDQRTSPVSVFQLQMPICAASSAMWSQASLSWTCFSIARRSVMSVTQKTVLSISPHSFLIGAPLIESSLRSPFGHSIACRTSWTGSPVVITRRKGWFSSGHSPPSIAVDFHSGSS